MGKDLNRLAAGLPDREQGNMLVTRSVRVRGLRGRVRGRQLGEGYGLG